MSKERQSYDEKQLLPLPILCGFAYVLNFAGILVLATSGATVNLLSSLIPSKNKDRSLPVVLSRFTAVTAILDFFATPIAGRISDIYGRKPIMVIAMAVSSICRILRVRTKSLIGYYFYGSVGIVAGTTFLTTINAAFSDVYSSQEKLASASATLNLFRGVSFILSPIFLGKLVGKKMRLAFHTSAALTGLTGLVIALFFHETRERKLISSSSFSSSSSSPSSSLSSQLIRNPLAFLILLQKSPRLFYLTVCSAFHEFCDPRTMGSVGTLLITQKLALTPIQYGQSMFFSGMTMVAGPLIVKKYFLKTLSRSTFSIVTSLSHSLSLVLKVGGNLFWFYIAMIASVLGGQSSIISNAELVHQAQSDNIESGEIAGARANLSALIRAIAPIIYGTLYSKNFRYPFYLGSFFSLMSQVFYYCATDSAVKSTIHQERRSDEADSCNRKRTKRPSVKDRIKAIEDKLSI
jgi:MFS family permease